jgi:hypothetical protein
MRATNRGLSISTLIDPLIGSLIDPLKGGKKAC